MQVSRAALSFGQEVFYDGSTTLKRLIQTHQEMWEALTNQSGRRTLRTILSFTHICFSIPCFTNPMMYREYPAFYQNFHVLPIWGWGLAALAIALALLFARRPNIVFTAQFFSAVLFGLIANAATSAGENTGTGLYTGLTIMSLLSAFLLSAELEKRSKRGQKAGAPHAD